MDRKDILRPILWATIEDFVGLWDILWEVNTILPNEDKNLNKSKIKKILKCYFKRELINFYSGVWGENDSFIELDYKDALKMLDQQKYWTGPSIHSTYLAISSTEKGEKVYNEWSLEQLSNLCNVKSNQRSISGHENN